MGWSAGVVWGAGMVAWCGVQAYHGGGGQCASRRGRCASGGVPVGGVSVPVGAVCQSKYEKMVLGEDSLSDVTRQWILRI